MFGFLKDKLKKAVDKFSKKAEEEAEVVEEAEEIKEEKRPAKQEKKETPKKEKKTKKTKRKQEKKPIKEEKKKGEGPEEEEKEGFIGKLFKKKEAGPEEKEAGEEEEPEGEAEPEKEKGIFKKITEKVTKVSLSENKFEDLFWELELTLLENNVAVEVIEKIKEDLKKDLVEKRIARKNLEGQVLDSLRRSVESLFDVGKIDLIKEAKKKKPYIVAIIGINGSGKTTTLAKLVHMLKKKKLEPAVAACDTFRAAAIQQLEEHTDKLGVKLIKHDYGSDPAAVAFDAVEHAKSKNKDIVLIDTAGRLHSNKNLMMELKKIIRIAKPDLKIFVGESIAGNDVVEQVKYFNDKVGIDAIILSKADTDEKGGATISVSYVSGKPIMYLGTGQKYEDLEEFDRKKLMGQIGLS